MCLGLCQSGTRYKRQTTYSEGCEKPAVLSRLVTLLKHLLDVLLGVLALTRLLEGLCLDGSLQVLELNRVAGGKQMGIVDRLNRSS
jgi:hypothetical protein